MPLFILFNLLGILLNNLDNMLLLVYMNLSIAKITIMKDWETFINELEFE